MNGEKKVARRINLNFTKILSVKINTEINNAKEMHDHFKLLFDELPLYRRGNPENPTKGYVNLRIDTQRKFTISEQGELIDLLLTKRYIHEDYVEIYDAITENDYDAPIHIPKPIITDIFWILPDYIFIKGNKEESDVALNALEEIFGDEVEMELIEFPQDFFMWLCCQQILNEGIIDSDLKIEEIEEDATEWFNEGSAGRIGEKTSVSGSSNAITSPQTLNALAGNQEFSHVKFHFVLDDFDIAAKINRKNGVFIYRKYVNFSGELETRYVYSLIFINRLLSIFNDWKKLPENDRKPPKECLQKMAQELQEMNTDGLEGFKDIISHYGYEE